MVLVSDQNLFIDVHFQVKIPSTEHITHSSLPLLLATYDKLIR